MDFNIPLVEGNEEIIILVCSIIDGSPTNLSSVLWFQDSEQIMESIECEPRYSKYDLWIYTTHHTYSPDLSKRRPQRGRGGCSQGFGVLPGFWSCSQGFGVKIGNLSKKSFKKGTFKSKIKKKGLCYPFLLSLFRYLWRKKSQILVPVVCGDHIVFKHEHWTHIEHWTL